MNKLIPYNKLLPITQLKFEETKPLLKLVEDTRVSIELLNYEMKNLPSPDILIDTLSFQEAKVSSNIENIVTTNDDLYKGIVFESFTAEAKEVANYKEALFRGYSALKGNGFISVNDIEEINAPVNKKQNGIRTNLAEFKENYTRIANVKDGNIEVLYTPPHGKELLNALLLDMLEYVYNDDLYLTHPLIKIALAHYQFESIHPFHDGNGRTGRILNILFMCEKGYLEYPILYASSYIIRNKNDYYKLLQECRENEDYYSFVMYMLMSFKETAIKTLDIIKSIKTMIEYYKSDQFLDTMKGQKAVLTDIIDIVFKKVYIRIGDLVDMGVHRETASKYLQQLVQKGLLVEEKLHKDKIFKNIELLNLFEREEKND